MPWLMAVSADRMATISHLRSESLCTLLKAVAGVCCCTSCPNVPYPGSATATCSVSAVPLAYHHHTHHKAATLSPSSSSNSMRSTKLLRFMLMGWSELPACVLCVSAAVGVGNCARCSRCFAMTGRDTAANETEGRLADAATCDTDGSKRTSELHVPAHRRGFRIARHWPAPAATCDSFAVMRPSTHTAARVTRA